jgi:glycosyltransferase involved in cell wall biosynthesis
MIEASVVVATHNRAGLLPALVAALEAQTLEPDRFEVVVVDDGSTDGTPEVLDRLAAASPLALRLLRVERNQGAGAARTLGVLSAAGPIVAFTDDDCRPAPVWLERGLRAMSTHGHCFVVGRTDPDPVDADRLVRPFARTLRSRSTRFAPTANVFYRREDIIAVGGFDRRFPSAAGEDTELSLRVRETGVDPVYEPDALVHHAVHPGGFRAALRDTRRWVDIPLVLRLHPGRRDELAVRRWFWKRSHPRVLLVLAGLALGRRWRPALLLAAPWVWFRVRVDPACPGPRRRWLALPAVLVVDTAEVVAMVEGSLKHRTLIL